MAVYKQSGITIPISREMLRDDLTHMASHPWEYPDRNPFPRFRLFRWLP